VFYSKVGYPETLRRIRFKTDEGKTLVFLTNNFALPVLTITELYRCRWQVELFFKWIKQHLRIKSFFGTSENAVKTQVWIAVSIYVLVAIVRKRLGLEASMYETLQILSLTMFETNSTRMPGASRPCVIVSQHRGRTGDGPPDLRIDQRECFAEPVSSCAVLDQTISHSA
jgi:hypothetical protein